MIATNERKSVAETAEWIEPHRRAYLDRIASQGYSACSRLAYERTVNFFCEELAGCSLRERKMNGDDLVALGQAALSRGGERLGKCATYRLGRFIDYLAETGVVTLPKPLAAEPTAIDDLREEYGRYLREQRAMSESSIYHCMRYFERFMAFRFGAGPVELSAVTPEDVISFLRQLKGRREPSHLRNFFKFLFWSGRTKRDLATAIPRGAQPRQTILPRHLNPADVQRLVDAALSDNKAGLRNHAILLLLARLGLRAPEVVAIQLEDIGWRAGEILIRGKGKLHDRMPLPEEVGKAIVNYIRDERRGDSRDLFVSCRAPHRPFKDAQIINEVLHKAFSQTGLTPPQKGIGSHLLRHSLATALLGEGASLEEISHVLRHRSRATTMIYAKCDIEALRSITQEWPSEGGAL